MVRNPFSQSRKRLTRSVKDSFLGVGVPPSYYSTPDWSRTRNRQKSKDKDLLDSLAKEERRQHPWMSTRLAYKIAQDNMKKK